MPDPTTRPECDPYSVGREERIDAGIAFLSRFTDESGKVNCTSLREAFEALETNASRYLFLRGLHDPGPDDPRVHTLDQSTDPVDVRLCFGDDLDKAVDAAMRKP